ncbi:hypothetical protein BURKHO8Y_60103 [Burkholderia sp. 8Y]|nr:hypothetical protein BURKHO8Y_60103 [Burkholderia sp. 8Y]
MLSVNQPYSVTGVLAAAQVKVGPDRTDPIVTGAELMAGATYNVTSLPSRMVVDGRTPVVNVMTGVPLQSDEVKSTAFIPDHLNCVAE